MTKRIDWKRGWDSSIWSRKTERRNSWCEIVEKNDQALLAQKTNQCLAANSALAAKESDERERRFTQKNERLLNHHDRTNAKTENFKFSLHAKAHLFMRKLDELLTSNNWTDRSDFNDSTLEPTNGFQNSRLTEARRRPNAHFEPRERERSRAAPTTSGWRNPV